MKSDHNNLNHPKICVGIFLKSNLDKIVSKLKTVKFSSFVQLRLYLEGTKRQFDDLGVLHCPGTDSFVGLVLAEKFRQLNIYLFCWFLFDCHQLEDRRVVHLPGEVIKEAQERHNGVARLDMLQSARHLPFGGRPAHKISKLPLSFIWR